ncbi:MAG: RidA family protein [Gemmatimonadota bacterium]|nr:RidA family protein [Gemmatimonadota bacterium]
MAFEVFNPGELGTPSGWNNGMLAETGGRVLFIAGQTARDPEGRIVSDDFVEQFGRALDLVLEVVRAAGGAAEDVGRMTIFVTDIEEYRASLRGLGSAYRERMGRHFPAMALLEVNRLVDDGAKIEIEATAVLSPTEQD